MNETKPEVHFIEGMGRIADFWGMPKAMGAIYGCIYLSAEPVSLDELVTATGLSKGSVSTNVRALERLQMVSRSVRTGDRKDYYCADPDLWNVARGILEQRRKSEFATALSSVRESLEMLDDKASATDRGATDKAQAAFQRERIKHMETFFNSLDKIVGSILLINKLSPANLQKLFKTAK